MISSKPLTRTTSSSLSSSLSFGQFSSSSASDDMLGTESGVYLGSSSFTDERVYNLLPSSRRYQRQTEKKTYPPPIPLLARRGNLPGYRPWKLTRRYVDGRLILTEERVKHDEYMEAIRENGRLIMNLVTFRDPEEDDEEEVHVEEAEMEMEELDLSQEEEEEEKQEEEEEEKNEEEEDEEIEEALSGHCAIPKTPSLEHEMERINGGQKCNLTYGLMSPNSSSPIPPMATTVV
ncbi:hypothetical protein M5689_025198 [Euphorbia peplus]|nr:hypothetical protein M5689_025198 [Euphorbia peplus]